MRILIERLDTKGSPTPNCLPGDSCLIPIPFELAHLVVDVQEGPILVAGHSWGAAVNNGDLPATPNELEWPKEPAGPGASESRGTWAMAGGCANSRRLNDFADRASSLDFRMGSTKVRRIDRRHHLSNSRLQDSRLDKGSDFFQEFMLSLHIRRLEQGPSEHELPGEMSAFGLQKSQSKGGR